MTQLQAEQSINDGSECYITAVFTDVNGNPYTPSSLQYRIDDLTNGANNVAWTPLTPTGSTYVLTVTSAQNVMNSLSKLKERRQVLFNVGIPGGTNRYDDYTYTLVRKAGTP